MQFLMLIWIYQQKHMHSATKKLQFIIVVKLNQFEICHNIYWVGIIVLSTIQFFNLKICFFFNFFISHNKTCYSCLPESEIGRDGEVYHCCKNLERTKHILKTLKIKTCYKS